MPTLKNKAHETFCLHYVSGEEVGNGTAAAREAYPKQTNGSLRVTAHDLLTKPNIIARIDELFSKKRDAIQFDAERWDREAVAATFTNIADVMEWDKDKATLKPSKDIGTDKLPAIQSVTIERSPFGITKTRVTLQPKHSMLNLCALRLGLFRQVTPMGELWVGGTFHRGGDTDGKETNSKRKGSRIAETRTRTDRGTPQKATGHSRETRGKRQKGSRRSKASRSQAVRGKARRHR